MVSKRLVQNPDRLLPTSLPCVGGTVGEIDRRGLGALANVEDAGSGGRDVMSDKESSVQRKIGKKRKKKDD